jgi:asparagine synthase (glutamine-hydrolysing)
LSLAVRQRRLADVPLGAFLSGGIDSSLIVALMQEQSSMPVQTFSIRFDNPAFNEADHAAAVARHLGTDHHEETCTDRQMFDIVEKLPDLFDEPFADSSAVPTYLVSKIARQHVTVTLSGDGGDELFFGYPRYWYHESGAWALALPRGVQRAAATVASRMPRRRLRRIADVLRSDDPDSYARFVTWWDPEEVARLTGAPAQDQPLYKDAHDRSAVLDTNARVGLLDLVSYLPEDILTKVDRASMAVSLEVRAPFLDHRVVEYALSLPVSLKKRGHASKWILRQLLYKRVPEQLIERPKMGFGVPLSDWFRGPLRDQMDEFCAGSDLEDLGLNPVPVRQLWAGFKLRQAHRDDQLWQIYVLIAWARKFKTISMQFAVSR